MPSKSLLKVLLEALLLTTGLPLGFLLDHLFWYPPLTRGVWGADTAEPGFSLFWVGLFLVPWIINLVRVLVKRCQIQRTNLFFLGSAIGLLIATGHWLRYFFQMQRAPWMSAYWVFPIPETKGPLWVNFGQNHIDLEYNFCILMLVVVASISLLIAGFMLFNFIQQRNQSPTS